MRQDEYQALDATALAELVSKKEVSPDELLTLAIERTEALNPTINAVVTPLYDEAKAQLGQLPQGPFRGVPFLLKDLMAQMAGTRMTGGSRFLKDFYSFNHSELTQRYLNAGLVIFGKTNTPELGILPTTESELLGPARNPWNTNHSTGGSSGGSAAAVAARMVPMAHANDGGGSIRIPASCCGLFGLKPTRGRISLGPDLGDVMNGLVVEHAVTRSVRDSARLLDATLGPMLGDPYFAAPPARPYAEEVGRDPGVLRIAYAPKPVTDVALHPDCRQAAEHAKALCEKLGHQVEEVLLPVDPAELNRCFIVLWSCGIAGNMELFRRLNPDLSSKDFEPLTNALAEMGQQMNGGQYLAAVAYLQMMTRVLAQTLQPYDVMLTPTLAEPPLPLGTLACPPENPLQGFLRAAEYVPFTPLQNVTGEPAMSVPLYWNEAGLPIGVQFSARYGDEATLFRLAAQLEATQPWADRRPG